MILQRIKAYIDIKGISVAAFERSLGMSNASFAKSLKNNGSMGIDKLEKFVSIYTDVNPIWLLTGKGEMLLSDEKATGNLVMFPTPDMADCIGIPIVDIAVAAGTGGYENYDNLEVIDTIQLPCHMIKQGKTYFCVRVIGHSMAPTLLDSSYIILRLLDRGEWSNMRDNYVYALTDNEGRSYIKRIKNRLHDQGFITCMSDNVDKANFPNFNLEAKNIHNVFYAEWYLSAKMPNLNETYYQKVNHLENDVEWLKTQMHQLLKR